MKRELKFKISLFVLAFILPLFLALYSYQQNGMGFFDSSLQGRLGDENGYGTIAKNIAEHGVFSASLVSPFVPDPIRTPIFPYFFALGYWLTGNFILSILLNILVGALTVVVVFEIAFIILGGVWPAFISALIFAVLPYRIFLSTGILADTLFLFLFSIFVLFFLKILKSPDGPKWWLVAGSGALLGLATLTRPIVQFFIVIPAFCCLFLNSLEIKKRVGMIVVMTFSFLLILSPWLYRNYVNFDKAFISSLGDYHMFVSYIVPWRAFQQHITDSEASQIIQKELAHKYGQDVIHNEVATAELGQQAKREILADPLSYIAFHLSTIPIYFLNNDVLLTLREAFNVNLPNINMAQKILLGDLGGLFDLVYSSQIFFVLLFIVSYLLLALKTGLGIAGVFMYFRRSIPMALFSLASIFYFPLIIGPEGNARFRLPVEIFLVIFSVFAIIEIRNFIKNKKVRS